MTMVQAVKEYVGIDFDAISDDAGPWPRQRPWG